MLLQFVFSLASYFRHPLTSEMWRKRLGPEVGGSWTSSGQAGGRQGRHYAAKHNKVCGVGIRPLFRRLLSSKMHGLAVQGCAPCDKFEEEPGNRSNDPLKRLCAATLRIWNSSSAIKVSRGWPGGLRWKSSCRPSTPPAPEPTRLRGSGHRCSCFDAASAFPERTRSKAGTRVRR